MLNIVLNQVNSGNCLSSLSELSGVKFVDEDLHCLVIYVCESNISHWPDHNRLLHLFLLHFSVFQDLIEEANCAQRLWKPEYATRYCRKGYALAPVHAGKRKRIRYR